MSYEGIYDAYLRKIEAALGQAMDWSDAPEPLRGAMRYSLMAGGKRLRPVLLLAACEMAGGDVDAALPYACAMEMIHTYSLIHDDLPAMDDDDLRRGRPTNHKVYGEGIAILAGDGLLSLAFEGMLEASSTMPQIQAMRRIAKAAGVTGMVAGQALDLTCEATHEGGEDELRYIHRHKTADLFIGAVTAGLYLGGASEDEVAAGERYACALGLAFQIRDDILDIEGTAEALGKSIGKDEKSGKLTWPRVFGMKDALQAVDEQTAAADEALRTFGDRADFLREMAARLLKRDV